MLSVSLASLGVTRAWLTGDEPREFHIDLGFHEMDLVAVDPAKPFQGLRVKKIEAPAEVIVIPPPTDPKITERMESLVALVAALAWPAVCLASLLLFRKPLYSAIGRLRGVSIGSITTDLTEVATTSVQDIVLAESGHDTNPEKQLPLIKLFDRMWRTLDPDQLEERVDEIARTYEIVRNSLQRDKGRTRELEVIAARFRLFAGYILAQGRPKENKAPGHRLAFAVALQVHPDPTMIHWLGNRVGRDHGAIGYHAALALKIAAGSLTGHHGIREAIITAKIDLGQSRGDRWKMIEMAEKELDRRTAGRSAA